MSDNVEDIELDGTLHPAALSSCGTDAVISIKKVSDIQIWLRLKLINVP